MTAKPKKDRIGEILDSLKKASAGDYSAKLDFASKDDELGLIADAVNKFLKKTEKKLSSTKPSPEPLEDAGRYRHILDNIEESYFEVDLKGNLTFFNDTVLRDLGYSPEELKGISFNQLVDRANAGKVYQIFHQVFLTGQPIKGFDWEILKKNGETIHVEASVALLYGPDGKPAGFRGIVRDVSWRVQSQKELQKSEEKYRTILEIMDEGYVEEDLSGRITFANDAACRIMGYSREQLFSMRYRDYLTPAVADQLKRIFQRVYRTRNPERLVDYDLVRRDGSVITYEINVALKYDDSGSPCGFRILTKDVTSRKKAEEQRRKSEEKYQNILEIMGEGYLETDIHGVLTYVNDAGCKLIGYSREELLGRKFENYSSPETSKQIFDTFREIYRTGKPRFMLDYGVIAKDGSPRIHQQNVALLTDESGHPKGFRVLVRNVTERRRAEDALRLSEEKYRRILESMDETYLETDLAGNFLFYNDSLCRVLGFSREELQNKNYRLISPPGHEKKIFEMFNEIYRTGQTKTFVNHAVMTKDGSLVYLEMSISLKRSPAGEPIGFSGISRDVTARLKAERDIQDRERHLRLITDNIHDIIWTMDFNLHWTYLSPSTLRITGFSPDEVMKIPLKAMLPPEIYNMAKQALTEELAKESGAVTSKEPRRSIFELPLMHKNGTHLWVEIRADFNRDENGKPFEIVGVTRDITKRKEAEEALRESEALYRKALETTSDGVSIIQDGRYVYMNQRFQTTMGIPDGYPIIGQPVASMLVPEDREAIRQYYEKRLRGEPTPGKHEVRVIKPDQSLMYLQVTSVDIVYQGKPALLNFMQDVTERRKAEETLRASEKRYRTMTENVNDIVWVFDLNLQITYASPSNARVTGFTPEEVIHMPLSDFVAPDSLKLAAQVLSEELAREDSGQPIDPNRSRKLEIEVFNKNGDNVWLEVNATFNRDTNGKATEILAVGRNITEHRVMEKALAESEQRYRMIVENMQDVICIMDLHFRFTYVSNDNLALTGYTKEEVKELPLDKLLTPESLSLITNVLNDALEQENDRRTFDDSVIRMMEVEILHKAGGTTWAEVTATLTRDAQHKPAAILLVVKDITERKKIQEALKESEQRYRMIVENMHDSISIVDLNLNYIYQSPSEIRVTGYTPEEIQRIPIRDQMTPESYELAEKRLAHELELEFSGEPVDPHRSISLELEVYHKNGGTIWQELSAVFQRDENGKPVGIILASRDITSKRKAEAALAESERRYRLMAENVNDIIWTMTMNMEFTYVSPSCFEVTGYTPEETRQTSLDRLLTPESYLRATQRLADEMALEQSGRPFDPQRAITLEIEAVHKNGSLLFLEITGTFNRNDQGDITEILILGRDFTQRRKAEQALAESEKLYRMIVENMQDVIWVMDFNLQYKYRSPSSVHITGYTMDEIMSIPPRNQMTPESYALAENILMEELAREQSGLSVDPRRVRTLELEVYRKDGGTAWIEATATFNRDSNGKAFEILLAARDITTRKQIENALRESEQRYRMIAENIQGSIALLDMNFEYQYISPSEVRMTGYTAEEIVKIPLKDQMTPASYQLVEQIFAEELELEFSGKPIDLNRTRTMDLEVYHKNGGTIWEELSATFTRDETGSPTGLLITTRNVTERKEAQENLKKSEQRYRMIIENIHEVIWTTDLNLKTTYMSPSCLPLTGYTPEELMSLPLEHFMTPDTLAMTASIVMEEITNELSGAPVDPYRSRTLEQEIIRKDGSTFWLELTGTFIRDKQGKATGMLLAGRDITERKKAEEEKNRLEAQLMQAQKMEVVGRLAGGVAHDFNNMLSVILGYVDLAKLRLAKQHPVLNDIAEIEKAAIRSRDITTQLLAFSRKQIIEPKIIDLNDLILHTQKAMIRLIGEDIDLKVFQEKTLWPIKVDPSQIEQILINLAVNARDAMPDGGKLTIETENRTLDDRYCENHVGFTPGQYVRLSFSDNGVGMNKNTLDHIFEPFFTTKEVGKGTGLGLATVYGIVKQNDGFINVYSEPGQGTTFSIYLPRATGEKDNQDESAEEPEIAGTGHILLAEDDAMVLQITRGMLESMGYTVTTAINPLDAIAYCENPDLPIDLVISDVIMPGMSGKELRNKLVEIRPDIRVIFMSGYTADVIAHHGVLEEGIMFLQKPFTMKTLASKVAEAMATR